MRVTSEILASVGIRNGQPCSNRLPDQLIVVELLNKIPEGEGGALHIGGLPTKFPGLAGGHCTLQLHQAILRFQEAHLKELQFADGHVDPGLGTLRLLNRLAAVSRSKLEVCRTFTFEVLDLHNFIDGPLGVITAINDVSIQIASYHFGPRSFWEPLLQVTKGVWDKGHLPLIAPEPVATEAFSGPISLLQVYRRFGANVFNVSLTVNLDAGRTSQLTFGRAADPEAVPGGYARGEMHLVDSAESTAAGLESRARVHRFQLGQ